MDSTTGTIYNTSDWTLGIEIKVFNWNAFIYFLRF